MASSMLLITHNVGAIVSATVCLALFFFIILNNHKKVVNITLALTNLAVFLFYLAHVVGANVTDPHLSKMIMMGNVSIILITIFLLHSVLRVIFKNGERKNIIVLVYSLGIALSIFYLLFPDTFLLDSVPKMYFPNYYVPGQFHWVMRIIFNGIIPLYMFTETLLAYRRTTNPIEQNRIKYLIPIMVIGYVVGFIPVLLVYNIPINPTWGIWFAPLYAIPMVYAIVTYELVDIKIVAKKAVLYGISVASLTALIIAFNFSSQIISANYPDFPFWIIPLISAVIAVLIGFFIWGKMREADLMKYEFITTVMHKFRNPVTHIKWATENLEKITDPEEEKEQLKYIESANEKLFELTNLLINVSETEDNVYEYHMFPADLAAVAEEAIVSSYDQLRLKNIKLDKNIETGCEAAFDSSRIKFVIQTLIENASRYTPDSAAISISLHKDGKNIVCKIKDNGIGISKEELPLLFSKFYRGHQARLADTEGMGIGLFMSKQIIKRHKGKIWAESEGPGKGSTFVFSIPAAA